MAPRGVVKPGSLKRRYSELEDSDKYTYYAFRRHLGYSPAEVDAMPWWERRMFIEVLNEEFTEEEPKENVYDDVSAFGMKAREQA